MLPHKTEDTMADLTPLDHRIRSRIVTGVNGLAMHVLEAGDTAKPCLLLLHGFPELAYSWRKVMIPLAEAGYHVVAPDQRGYGRTTGHTTGYDVDLREFRLINLVRDAMGLLTALGRDHVMAVIGHDFGSPVAAHCALIRPDIFRRVALMSAPFTGVAAMRAGAGPDIAPQLAIDPALAALARPRKHYHLYYSTRPANADMTECRQGLHAFLRAYYHQKSAHWTANKPHPLTGWTAGELAKLPTYYVMDRAETMAETVAHEMPSTAEIAACRWMSEAEMAVYAAEYGRTGFQGGLNWYRTRIENTNAELDLFSGRRIDVPSLFIGGAADWGVEQTPGAADRMRRLACSDMRAVHSVPGAGHWVQQEQPEATVALLLEFLRATQA